MPYARLPLSLHEATVVAAPAVSFIPRLNPLTLFQKRLVRALAQTEQELGFACDRARRPHTKGPPV
jgi:hypothetical protein